MYWWMWVIFRLLLLAGELLTPGGFYVLFFGVAGVCVGLVTRLFPAFPAVGQWLLFSVLAVASLLVFRRPLLEWFRRRSPSKEVDSLVGETAEALEDIAPGQTGRAELRGAAWKAENAGAVPIACRQRCRVVRVEGLTLFIEGR